MREADTDPGHPDTRGAGRYLWWLVTSQRRRIIVGALLGSTWMIGLTLPPYLLSRAIDDGLAPGRTTALFGWVGALLAVGVLTAWLAIMRHRTMTRVRLDAAFRTVRVVVRHATRLGATLPRTVTAGEVVTIGISDVWTMSRSLTVTGPGVGAVLAYLVVAVLLWSVSPSLALVVLLGVLVLAGVIGPLLRRFQQAGGVYRARQGALTARIVDVVGGLRVLNGLGGKDLATRHYRRDSQELRAEGYRVGAVTSWVEALGVGLPGLFLAAVTWLAARLAAQHAISIGDLVAVYGYAAVLVVPVSSFIEGGAEVSQGIVAARRVVRFLRLTPDLPAEGALPGPASPAVLRDPVSGVEVAPGGLTVLAGARSVEAAAVLDRLGGFTDSAATWGGVRLDQIASAQVRDRILVADNEAHLFSGALRDVVSGRCERDEPALRRAVHAALADDIVQGLPAGLDARVAAQGHNLSGGQRQRVRLVRALLADPEVLLAVDPTSAVDAHTEAAIAARLRTIRAGRTTVVTSTSPLLLDQADFVYHLVGGHAVGTGTHRELLAADAGYRRLVTRDAADDVDTDVAEAGG